ncbi:MAG: hypothetical protein CSA58_08160 [Micrococcales bacterium]|nr:MAG: hypothetical protein CSB46_10030 [Micrococcales bacterium]PIE26683.1 MAG: hypothetical protein CSA58_08160 [Micrococcales bacterium]
MRGAAAASSVVRAVNSRRGEGSPPLTDLAAAVPRMVRARLKGEYDGLSNAKAAAVAAAVAYAALPVDLIPEALLPVLGLVDDIVVLGWAAGALVDESEKFLAWEQTART